MRTWHSRLSAARLAFGLAMLLVLCSCSSGPVLTADQRQILQSRFFSGISYQDLFTVVRQMLKDSGYQVTQMDLEHGVIVGTLRSQEPLSFTTRFGRDSHRALRQGERFEALFNIKTVDSENIGVRVSLQRLPEYSLGVVRGEEITDPKEYEKLFVQLQGHVKKWFAKNNPSKPPSDTSP
jgi:hypothetical protein